MMLTRRGVLKTSVSGVLSMAATHIYAQDKEPIRLVCGFAPGGTTDTLCRILADALTVELGTTVIVETKSGAGGRIAAEYVKNAKPDGKTYLMGPDGWAIFPSAMFTPAVLRYDILKDLKAVAQVVSYPLALAVNNELPVRSLSEYAAWLKKNPQQASFGTPAPNGQLQYVGWLVGQSLGTPLEPVVYKGNAPMLLDLLSGQLPAAILVAGDAIKQPRDRIRILGVMAEQRWALAPDIPTFKEQGVSIQVDDAWQAMWGTAGSPPSALARMEQAVKTVLGKPDVRQAILTKAMVSPTFAPGAQLESRLQNAIAHWRDVIRQSGYQPEKS